MMQDWLFPYASTVSSIGAGGVLLLAQLVVLDVAGIRGGHAPGAPIATDPSNFLFRASRAHANTNESIAAFILFALYGIFSNASPGWLGAAAWTWVAARAAHMLFYYANIPIARSVSFGVGLLALIAMFACGFAASAR
jgi:uncharacterized MAPEG superfamily protein